MKPCVPNVVGVTGLAHECPDTNRLSFERTAGPPLPNTIGTHGLIRACPHPSGPSLVCQHPPKTTLDKHRSFAPERPVEHRSVAMRAYDQAAPRPKNSVVSSTKQSRLPSGSRQ